nr:hypothetical protein [Tanacetum cinerariifolium]
MLNGICPLCHLSNSCANDHNPNSFDCPPDSYHPPHPTYETYSGDSCGNDSQSGYDCPPQSPLNYEPESGYTQNYNSCPHDSPSFPQQYPCCDDCGVTYKPYQCQPKNHDYYDEQNSCYDSNYFGFDQIQTPQYTVNHQIFNAHNDLLNSQNKLMEQMTSMCKMVGQIPAYYDDDDDYNFAITPNEPVDSLIMRDEHLDTISATESDEFRKSSVENLVPNPSESEGENDCDMLACFTTFSNILFDSEYEFDSVDNQSLHNEDFPEEIFLNPSFEEEINSMRIGQHHFNVESDLIGSLLNHDSSIIPSSSKIDSLLDKFADELPLLKSIPPGIDETDYHPVNEIHLFQRLLYDNSSPRLPEEFVSKNSYADVESFSPFPIRIEDSNSLMEEIDLTFTPDDPMPPSIEEDDDDSRDILIREELLDNYSLPLHENESFHFDILLSSRPLAKPPDGNTGILNIKMMGDVSDQKNKLMEQMTSMCEMVGQLIQKKQEEKKIQEDQAANARYWKIPAYYDDDDDYNFAITPNEPVDSLSMGDEHLDTVSATESNEFIKSSVENLVPNPSESEGENGCDLLACFTTFSNILFDAEYEFDSVDNQSLHNEDFPEEIFSNPLFEEEINSMRIGQYHSNVESDLIGSLLNHDSSIIPSSSKIDSLLDEFAGELPLLKSILPGIDETDYHPENEIRLSQKLLYDNSSPRPPEEFVSENSNADDESFSPSPIPIEDSDYPMEEIDLTFTPDDPMPPSIEEDNGDSRDILIREELLDNYSLPLAENESFHLFSRPPVKPPDDNTGILNIKMMGDVSDQKVPIPKFMITRVSNQEKSPDLLSHRGFKIFQPSAECPMKIHGKNIPTLDVPRFHFYPP